MDDMKWPGNKGKRLKMASEGIGCGSVAAAICKKYKMAV